MLKFNISNISAVKLKIIRKNNIQAQRLGLNFVLQVFRIGEKIRFLKLRPHFANPGRSLLSRRKLPFPFSSY